MKHFERYENWGGYGMTWQGLRWRLTFRLGRIDFVIVRNGK